jgi:hypothetical protein
MVLPVGFALQGSDLRRKRRGFGHSSILVLDKDAFDGASSRVG